MLFSWSHQATGPVRLDTAVHLWFGRLIRRTPRLSRAMPVRASCGPRKGILMFSISYGTRTGPCGTRNGAARHPYGHVRELIQSKLTKIPHGRRIWPYGARTGPLRSPHGLLTDCLGYQNPYGTRKLTMHALKVDGPARGGKIRTAPCGQREWTYDFCSNQPGNTRQTISILQKLQHIFALHFSDGGKTNTSVVWPMTNEAWY